MYKFGSDGIAPGFSPRALKWTVIILWCVGIAVIVLTLWVARMQAGCSLPPPDPLDLRRDTVCVLLRRGPDCLMRVREMAATIESDEQNYRVSVGGEFVGEYAIFEGQPIDPDALTPEIVRYHLRYQVGTPELQMRFRSMFGCRKVAFVSDVLEWTLGETKVLIGCAS